MPLKGFTTISVKKETYDEIMKLAQALGGVSAAELVDYMVKLLKEQGLTFLHVRTILLTCNLHPEKRFIWPKVFPASSLTDPYQAILRDPEINEYLSTAWIRSATYLENVGHPQFIPLNRVFLGSLRIEKIFILSPKVEKNQAVWKWIWTWILFQNIFRVLSQMKVLPEEVLKIWVLLEEKINKKDLQKALNKEKEEEIEKYFDMGIYGQKAVGFLTLDENSQPLQYEWCTLETEITNAREAFKMLTNSPARIEPKDYLKVDLLSDLI